MKSNNFTNRYPLSIFLSVFLFSSLLLTSSAHVSAAAPSRVVFYSNIYSDLLVTFTDTNGDGSSYSPNPDPYIPFIDPQNGLQASHGGITNITYNGDGTFNCKDNRGGVSLCTGTIFAFKIRSNHPVDNNNAQATFVAGVDKDIYNPGDTATLTLGAYAGDTGTGLGGWLGSGGILNPFGIASGFFCILLGCTSPPNVALSASSPYVNQSVFARNTAGSITTFTVPLTPTTYTIDLVGSQDTSGSESSNYGNSISQISYTVSGAAPTVQINFSLNKIFDTIKKFFGQLNQDLHTS